MNDFDIYETEEVQNHLDTLKELKRQWNAAHEELVKIPDGSPQPTELVERRNRINQAIRDTKRQLDGCVEHLKRI